MNTPMKPRCSTTRQRIIQSLIILTLWGSAPSHAFDVVTDPAHTAETVASRYLQLQQWVSTMQSKIRSVIDLSFLDLGANPAQTQNTTDKYEKLKQKLKEIKRCDKIKDKTSNDLCLAEEDLKKQRLDAMTDFLTKMDGLQARLKAKGIEYNAISLNAATVGMAGAATGRGNTSEGRSQTVQAEIEAVYEDAKTAKNNLDAAISAIDNQLKLVHDIRLEYARAQFEAKEPSKLQKLASTTVVEETLRDEARQYKQDISELKSKNQY